MENYYIETVQIDGQEPYLKIYFEDVVDKDAIKTWLNLQGFLKKANVNEDDNCKISAIVKLLPDSDMHEVKKKLDAALSKI